jgi:hypothetical protein
MSVESNETLSLLVKDSEIKCLGTVCVPYDMDWKLNDAKLMPTLLSWELQEIDRIKVSKVGQLGESCNLDTSPDEGIRHRSAIQAAESLWGSLTTETAAIATGELAHCLKRRVFLIKPTCSSPFPVYPGGMEILQ